MSACPSKAALQQYLSNPRSSRTLAVSSPALTLFLYSSQLCPTGFPHPKQRTGIKIVIPPRLQDLYFLI